MLIVMKQDASPDEIRGVERAIEARGFKAHPIPGAQRTAIGITGNRGAVDRPVFESLPGVLEVIPVTHGYKLVSREVKPEDTVVEVGDVRIGGKALVIAAGPCAVESLDQVLTVARGVKKAGANLLRGGAFKPRTSPYAFQGLGEEGLKILAAAREETGLPVVTEVLDPEGVDLVEHYADVIQIGARNMQNFSLLKRCGKARKPVLLKRGLAATLEEFLMSAEYILAEGNYDVDPVRARGAHVLRLLAQHPGPRGGSGGEDPVPPPDPRRSLPRDRPAGQGGGDVARGDRGRGRRAARRGAPRPGHRALRRTPVDHPGDVRRAGRRAAADRPGARAQALSGAPGSAPRTGPTRVGSASDPGGGRRSGARRPRPSGTA